MKTSARNHLTGKVTDVKEGAVNDEIELTLNGGQVMTAIVTHGSAMALGLKAGADAFGLIKASSVIVVTDLGSARLSARNQFKGTVSAVTPGAVNTEVEIDAGGGLRLAAIVTVQSAQALGLVVGMPATAIFKASSVIVGVPG